jgi:hypothetical protein
MNLVILSGTISKLKRSKRDFDPVPVAEHRMAAGTAVAATAMGMGATGKPC